MANIHFGPANNNARQSKRLFWTLRIFLVIAILWNLWAAYGMAAQREQMLSGAVTGAPDTLLSLVIVFLLIGVATTAFLVFDPRRYWPLLWIGAFGRMGAAWVLLNAWSAGAQQAIVPAAVDLTLGVGCLVFAILCLLWLRRDRSHRNTWDSCTVSRMRLSAFLQTRLCFSSHAC